jgi:hypothetical protein
MKKADFHRGSPGNFVSSPAIFGFEAPDQPADYPIRRGPPTVAIVAAA